MSRPARLVGDGLERPANARALLDVAAMFGIDCLFRDTRGLSQAWSVELGGGALPTIDTSTLLHDLLPIVAIENAPGARSVFDAILPPGGPSIVVGNERLGIRGDLLRAAGACVEIPMTGRTVTTLNVASAAAVALFYLMSGQRRPMHQPARSAARRPTLLLAAPIDHVEAGSVIRSAAAFGWRALALDDRHHVWFGVSRGARAEGRAAARSRRNATHVIPAQAARSLGFARIVVAGARVDGPPLHRVELGRGPSTLLVLPDEGAPDPTDWSGMSSRVEFARVTLPSTTYRYRYRLIASIVLAEVARQLGPSVGRRRVAVSGRLRYESALAVSSTAAADIVLPSELRSF